MRGGDFFFCCAHLQDIEVLLHLDLGCLELLPQVLVVRVRR